jgi:hypothetical protein
MDISFVGENDIFIVIYLDDMTIFSKIDEDHVKHLRHIFVKCKKFGLSLKLNKYYFSMIEGNILGHIVSKEGVNIDQERLKEIKKISLPRNKKEIQSFLGRINLLRIFVPNFTEMVKKSLAC